MQKYEQRGFVINSSANYAIVTDGNLYAIGFNYYNETVELTRIASLPFAARQYETVFLGNQYIISGNQMYYFDPTSNEPITPIDTLPFYMSSAVDDSNIQYKVSRNTDTSCYMEYIHIRPGYQKLVALRYNGEYYYRSASGMLTAGQPDVKEGKTFIGWMGYPETGTMKESEEEEEEND